MKMVYIVLWIMFFIGIIGGIVFGITPLGWFIAPLVLVEGIKQKLKEQERENRNNRKR